MDDLQLRVTLRIRELAGSNRRPGGIGCRATSTTGTTSKKNKNGATDCCCLRLLKQIWLASIFEFWWWIHEFLLCWNRLRLWCHWAYVFLEHHHTNQTNKPTLQHRLQHLQLLRSHEIVQQFSSMHPERFQCTTTCFHMNKKRSKTGDEENCQWLLHWTKQQRLPCQPTAVRNIFRWWIRCRIGSGGIWMDWQRVKQNDQNGSTSTEDCFTQWSFFLSVRK